MEFSRQEYWSGLHFLLRGDLPNPGIKPKSPARHVDSLRLSHPGITLVKTCIHIFPFKFLKFSDLSVSKQNTPQSMRSSSSVKKNCSPSCPQIQYLAWLLVYSRQWWTKKAANSRIKTAEAKILCSGPENNSFRFIKQNKFQTGLSPQKKVDKELRRISPYLACSNERPTRKKISC